MSRPVTRALAAFAVVVLLLLGGIAFAGARYEPNTDIPAGFSGRHVPVLGTPIRVRQEGAGRNVLLIHGSPGSIEDWAPVFDSLSASFSLTAFDRQGNGFSGDTGDYSPKDNARTALALVRALKLEHVVVVGHSYGGSTALAMALEHPPEVDAYVIVDSATYEPSREADVNLRMLDVPLLGFGFATLVGPRLAPGKIRKGILEQFRGAEPPEGFVELRTRIWSTPKVTHAIAEETLGMKPSLAAMSPGYPRITAPVFIVAEADDPFRRATAERLHRDVRGSSLDLVPGTGHYIQFQKPDAVVQAIRRAADAVVTAPRNGP